MAESADILRAPHQKVVLPDLAAGCSMADMAAPDQLEICWRELERDGRADGSGSERPRRARSGHLHQFVRRDQSIRRRARRHRLHVDQCARRHEVGVGARREAASCFPISTSAATPPTRWACRSIEMVVWDPNEMWGGLEPEQVKSREADPVEGPLLGAHALHRRADRGVPQEVPRGRVVAHPECTFDVVQAADESGSTEYIINTVKDSPAGSVWAVATEVHLVNRLGHDVAPDKTSSRSIRSAASARRCSASRRTICSGFSKACVEGKIHNQIIVPERSKSNARLALDRMLR